MKQNKIAVFMAKSSIAVLLAVLMVISTISMIAVNTEIGTSAASVDLEKTGNTLPQGKDVYLIGSFNGWKENDANWKLTKLDNNHYTGSFQVTGQSSAIEFKVFINGGYYSANGKTFGADTTVTGLNLSQPNNDKISLISSTSSDTITLAVELFCEYSGDSRLTIKQTKSGVSGDITGNTTDAKVYTASSKINKQTSSTELISVKGSFYDYYMDEEVNGKWRSSLTGYYRTVERDGGDYNETNKAAREPFERFNQAIGAYQSKNTGWKYPLYFGNFYGKPDGYTGRGVSNLKEFKLRPNDSNATTSGITGSVSALVDTQLNSSNMLTADGVVMPYFDAEWLTKNGYATVINSPFPMRKSTTAKGNDYYEFNSNNGTDNCYFTGYTDKNFVMNYAYNSNKVKDSLSGYSTENDGYGFFPFDLSTEHSGNAYDFGFGMRLDMDFTLGENGKTGEGSNQEDTVFNFSGDDDLWIYLDGVLVLDMGGDHKKTSGCINFSKLKSYVNNVDTTYKTGKSNYIDYKADTSVSGYGYSADFPQLFTNGAGTAGKFDNNNPNIRHTLTVFCMERGMIESNLKVGFNFTPVKDSLKVNKTVDTSTVNSKIQSAVGEADTFGFTSQESNSQSGSYTSVSPDYKYADGDTQKTLNAKATNGKFTLGDKDSALMSSQFTIGDWLKINEGSPEDTTVTADLSNLIYFDPSKCSWFMNNGTVPVISINGGTSYNKMYSYTVSGKTIYYYPLKGDTSSFILGRWSSSQIYNKVQFSNQISSGKNFVVSDANWRTTSDGDTSVAAYPISGSSIEYKEYPYSPPSTQTSVLASKKISGIEYDTSWTLTDSSLSSKITEGTGKEASFQYINSSKDTMLSTHLVLDYVNTPKAANITVDKVVVDDNGDEITGDTTEFPVELLLDIDNDGNYESYGLKGNVTNNNNYVFEKIPVGVKYKLVESATGGYTNVKNGTVTGTLTADATVTVTNRRNSAKAAIKANKTLEGNDYYGKKFAFTMEGLALTTVGGITTQDTSSVREVISEITEDKAGQLNFSEIKYDKAGTYLYKITENNIDDTDYQKDSKTIVAKVVVSKNAQGELEAATFYYKGELQDNNYSALLAGSESNTPLTFENFATDGSVKIVKSDEAGGAGNKIPDTEFAIYKVDNNTVVPGDGDTPVQTKKTDENGEVVFTGLDIFKADYSSQSTDFSKEYQMYCVVEKTPASGYTPNMEPQYITLPTAGKYDITLSFVDGAITVPDASGTPNSIFVILGCSVIGFAAFFTLFYIYTAKRKKAKARCRHGR